MKEDKVMKKSKKRSKPEQVPAAADAAPAAPKKGRFLGKKNVTAANSVREDAGPATAAGKEKEPALQKIKSVGTSTIRPAPPKNPWLADEELLTFDFPAFPYEADAGDHFETPEEAYRDLKAVLDFHIKQTRNRMLLDSDARNENVVVYDPYFCRGNAKKLLERVMNGEAEGEAHEDAVGEGEVVDENEVHNENATTSDYNYSKTRLRERNAKPPIVVKNELRDFYEDVAKGTVPEHDLLVTNPPYSGDHKQKLLDYLLQLRTTGNDQKRPFAMLIPSWTCQKKFFRKWLFDLGNLVQDEKQRKKKDKLLKKGKTPEEAEAAIAAAADRSSGTTSAMKKSKKFNENDVELERRAEVFYIAPYEKYDFVYDKLRYETARYAEGGKRKSEAPFFGLWVCGGFQNYQGFVDKFAERKITLDLKGLQDQKLCRSEADVKRRRELNPKQKERAERFGMDKWTKKGKKTPAGGVRKDNGKAKPDAGAKAKVEGGRDEALSEGGQTVGKTMAEGAAKENLAAAAPKGDKPICRHFQSAAGCSRGEKCKFAHISKE
eukprot:g3568.t1